jgi:hypothetical protein
MRCPEVSMRSAGSKLGPYAVGAVLAFCPTPSARPAPPDVRVTAGDVTDSRFSGRDRTGGLSLKVKVRGDGMDGVEALRFVLSDARDDLGEPLLPETRDPNRFRDVRDGVVEESLSLRSPARGASSFSVSGAVELFIPRRDQNALVKVAGALAHPERPLSSPGLEGAGVTVALLPRAREAPGVVRLRSRATDLDRIRSIRILGPDGTEIRIVSTGRISDGEVAVMTLEAEKAVPDTAMLVFSILTDEAVVSVPFGLKEIPLP